jgi:hypothetical protein
VGEQVEGGHAEAHVVRGNDLEVAVGPARVVLDLVGGGVGVTLVGVGHVRYGEVGGGKRR